MTNRAFKVYEMVLGHIILDFRFNDFRLSTRGGSAFGGKDLDNPGRQENLWASIDPKS
jgi:hypothetical protein